METTVNIKLRKDELEDIVSWAHRCASEGFISEKEWELVRKLEQSLK